MRVSVSHVSEMSEQHDNRSRVQEIIYQTIKMLSSFAHPHQIKSNQITFIVTSPQHKCLGEWNSYERAPDSAKKQQTIYL